MDLITQAEENYESLLAVNTDNEQMKNEYV